MVLTPFAFGSTAEAIFPGANGEIAFATGIDAPLGHIDVMNPDDSGRARLVTSDVSPGLGLPTASEPAWSTDGQSLAFQMIPASGADPWSTSRSARRAGRPPS